MQYNLKPVTEDKENFPGQENAQSALENEEEVEQSQAIVTKGDLNWLFGGLVSSTQEQKSQNKLLQISQ